MRAVDVVIIGGSLAGAACVRDLTRAGIDAVAIERDRFPREKVCGGFLSPGAVEILDELNVLGTLRAAGAEPVRYARIRTTGATVEIPFRRAGLGVSRRTLDAVLGAHDAIEHGNVQAVERISDNRFRIGLGDGDSIQARIVIDAAGKLSRFGRLVTSPQFGVQFEDPETHGDGMDFWFFPHGYGGTVRIEGGRSNACFLIRRDALPMYIGRPGSRVTGPVAYRAGKSAFIGIGDAAGMIDPFCGEGMHHALDTGRIAAASVVRGLQDGWDYLRIQRHYEAERSRRWMRKRALARVMRSALQFPGLRDAALRRNVAWFVNSLWG